MVLIMSMSTATSEELPLGFRGLMMYLPSNMVQNYS